LKSGVSIVSFDYKQRASEIESSGHWVIEELSNRVIR